MMSKLDRLLEKTITRVFGILKIKVTPERLKTAEQLFRFCVVGLMNTAVSYVTYAIFVLLQVHYIISSLIAFVVSTANAYFWNDRFVFKNSGGRWRGILKTYCSYALTGIFLYNALLYLLVDICGISELLSPLLVLVVTIPCNFLLNKFWTFRKK